jgi:hypothetical protein
MVDILDLDFLEASIGISQIEIDPIKNDANVIVLIIVTYSGYEGTKKFTLNINLEDAEIEKITLGLVKWSNILKIIFIEEKEKMAKLLKFADLITMDLNDFAQSLSVKLFD